MGIAETRLCRGWSKGGEEELVGEDTGSQVCVALATVIIINMGAFREF